MKNVGEMSNCAEQIDDRAADAERERVDAEHGHHDDRREHPRQDELLRRIGAERADGVDLLGDVHRTDLGRHAAGDAAADDDRRERGRELTTEGERDDARDVFEAAEAAEAERELDCHDHADEDRRDRDDAHRTNAEGLELLDRRADLERPPEERLRRPCGEERDLAEVLQEAAPPRRVVLPERRLRRRRRDRKAALHRASRHRRAGLAAALSLAFRDRRRREGRTSRIPSSSDDSGATQGAEPANERLEQRRAALEAAPVCDPR